MLGGAILTTIFQIKCPFRSWRSLSIELRVLLINIPTDIIKNFVVLEFRKIIDAEYLFNLPRLEYADEQIQNVDGVKVQP
jgi:hypothetical protein